MRAYGRTLFELIYHNTPIYAVDRQPLFCTFCARAQNVSKQSCHLGPSGPNGKIREKIFPCVLVEEELCSYLTFQTFSLEDVMKHGTPLLGSIGTEFDSHSAVCLRLSV